MSDKGVDIFVAEDGTTWEVTWDFSWLGGGPRFKNGGVLKELEAPADLQCDTCKRKTWSSSERPGRACGMRQPDDRLCVGLLRKLKEGPPEGGPTS